MTLFLLFLLVFFFFYLFKVSKDKRGHLKVERKQTPSLTIPLKMNREQLLNFSSRYLRALVTVVFFIGELILLINVLPPIQTLLKVRASQLLPDKFAPIARFAANMNWDTKTIMLDASMSKAYEDKINNYIWRIDDGTSLVGSKELQHTFVNPGYYLIQLSIVDADNQSDVATCQISVPPQELEKVATHERVEQSKTTDEKVQDVEYEWAPVGTFFNYSKMAYNDRSYANLKSQYIESGCGYSNRTYNTQSNSYVDFFHDDRVQKAMADLLQVALLGLVVAPVVYLLSLRFLGKHNKR